MPFGANMREDGVRFRLWAPGATTVDLILEDTGGAPATPMQRLGSGWFETRSKAARAGSLYRYRIDGGTAVPDPASRFQPQDVHGPSLVVDPAGYAWRQNAWTGQPWEAAVVYELHVGTFTPEGNYDGVVRRLDYLVRLGITAIELMPIADFAGERNWGYDGVLPFAPDSTYGSPYELKRLVDAAHARGLMIFLDVVYNHFGPEGNYLHVYAPQFFSERIRTPWGAGIDFGRREVREFFIHNALYWLEEYRFDGLRLDAVHAIVDRRSPDILEELAQAVADRFDGERQVHLVLENDDNVVRYLDRNDDGRPEMFTAQWNDDIHHALHVIATGEASGYYEDYADRPVDRLARCLTEGFAYQGEASTHRNGKPRGEPSAHLPATAFVSFLQNHDQIGNRAFGERIVRLAGREPLEALVTIMALAPSPPLLFMGEEWGALQPFPFFCDFHDDLADQVREGRRREFARFSEFSDPAARERIPDPNLRPTFESAVLDWRCAVQERHADWLALYRELLRLRRESIVPKLSGFATTSARSERFGSGGLLAVWTFAQGAPLMLLANLADEPCSGGPRPAGRALYSTHPGTPADLPAWYAAWSLDTASA